jgi:hypothetical protein
MIGRVKCNLLLLLVYKKLRSCIVCHCRFHGQQREIAVAHVFELLFHLKRSDISRASSDRSNERSRERERERALLRLRHLGNELECFRDASRRSILQVCIYHQFIRFSIWLGTRCEQLCNCEEGSCSVRAQFHVLSLQFTQVCMCVCLRSGPAIHQQSQWNGSRAYHFEVHHSRR